MSVKFLKIKLKSLAAESRFIRREERRTYNRFGKCVNPALREALYLHRIIIVRDEARATLLAYGFLRGRTYRQMENSNRSYPPLGKVARMVRKYGSYPSEMDALNAVREWAFPTVAEKAA